MGDWWTETIVVRRRGLLIAAAVVGLACAGAIVYSYEAATTAANEAVARKQDRVRTDAQIARIARRIVHLEAPSAKDVERRIRHDLLLCIRERRCLRAIRRAGLPSFALQSGGGGGGGGSSGGGSSGSSPPGGGGSPLSPHRPPRPSPSPGVPRVPPPSQTPPSPPSPSRPNLTAPLPVQVCTMLVGINCP